MKLESLARLMALIILTLLTIHLSQDIVYHYEPSTASTLIPLPVAALWFYLTYALAGRRSGYALLLLGAAAATVVPVIHMSSHGVRDEVVQSPGGLFFIWTLLALAMSAGVSALLSLHGLWRPKG